MLNLKQQLISLFSIVSFTLSYQVFADSCPSILLNQSAGDVKALTGSVMIEAPPEAVWQTLTNYEEMRDFMPGYQKSQVLAANGTNKKLDVAVKVLKCLPAFKYQMSVKENKKAYQLEASRISGDFKSIRATYKLSPLAGGNQTLLSYQLQIDVGEAVPKIGLNRILTSNAKNSLAAIQTQSTTNYRKTILAKR